MDFKTLLTAYARMAKSAVPKLFWALPKSEFGENASHNDPSLKHYGKNNDRISDFGSKLLSSFLMSAFHSFLKYLQYRQRQTAVTLKIENFGLARLGTAHFLTLCCPCLGFDWYLKTTGIDQLTYHCVMFQQLVFLNFTAEMWW